METVFAFPVSILVRKPSQIKRFPHFLRSDEKVQDFCSRMTKNPRRALRARRGHFCFPVFLRSGKSSSKLRVPFIPDANVGTDDFSAQGRRGFCNMQRLIAVEGYGQICMGSTLGNLTGIRIDAAG